MLLSQPPQPRHPLEIEPSSSRIPVRGIEARPVRRVNSTPADSGDFAEADALSQALKATPDVRPEAVEQARSLVSVPHYPPEEMIRRLSQLFALEFGSSRSTDKHS